MTRRDFIALAVIVGLIGTVYGIAHQPSEPFFYNDETRHVMTCVFFHDALADVPITHPKQYAIRYYLQYPALGLVAWPPCFYAIAGCWMRVFGTSYESARLLVAVFAVVNCFYVYQLTLRTIGRAEAWLATIMVAGSPLVFDYSRQVMLEIPTLALSMMALVHFHRYVERAARYDAVLSCLAAAMAALTRYDGVFLLPMFGLLLLDGRRWRVLRRPVVWASIAGAIVLTLPFYWLAYGELTWSMHKTMTQGADPTATHLFALQNIVFYPSCIPEQVGWSTAIAAALGLLLVMGDSDRRRRMTPWLALAAATYLTFTPLAEQVLRHAIYWVPSICVLAAIGIVYVARQIPRGVPLSMAVVSVAVVFVNTLSPAPFARGYAEAARYVVDHSQRSRICLMDGFLNGNFIYQIRRYDPERRFWILRGDKLFYAVHSDPHSEYREWVTTDGEILEMIRRYDPEYIVVEEPPVEFRLPMALRLREVLKANPDRFELERRFPVTGKSQVFEGVHLDVYRNKQANPNRDRRLKLPMLWQGTQYEADLP
jgi:hypothetical protein